MKMMMMMMMMMMTSNEIYLGTFCEKRVKIGVFWNVT